MSVKYALFTLPPGPHHIKSVFNSKVSEAVSPNLSGQMMLTPLAKTDDSLHGQKDTFNVYLETLLAAGSSDYFLVVPYKT